MTIARVGVVGLGTIGASWAAWFASQGLRVTVHDSDPACLRRGLAQARQQLRFLVRQRLVSRRQALRGARELRAGGLEDAVRDADWIQESAAETYAIKGPLLARLDALAPRRAILASSSSGLLISRLQRGLRHPGRTLIAHPFNPPHLLPLVELVPGKRTDPRTVRAAKVFFERAGKTPVILRKELPGHLANRLSLALWREALGLVASGAASVEDVDKAVSAGPGLRWALLGPYAIYHLGGGPRGFPHFMAHIGKAFEAYLPSLTAWRRVPPAAKRKAIAGVAAAMRNADAAELARWRDRALVQVLRAARAPRGGRTAGRTHG